MTQPADGGEGAIPYYWSWQLELLFLSQQAARCITLCSL